jgi:hypothetical protein
MAWRIRLECAGPREIPEKPWRRLRVNSLKETAIEVKTEGGYRSARFVGGRAQPEGEKPAFYCRLNNPDSPIARAPITTRRGRFNLSLDTSLRANHLRGVPRRLYRHRRSRRAAGDVVAVSSRYAWTTVARPMRGTTPTPRPRFHERGGLTRRAPRVAS